LGQVTPFPLPGSDITLNEPERIRPDHELSSFDCGTAPLNDWLRKRALVNEGGGSRTYVVTFGATVVGYFAIATGAVSHTVATGKVRRNMPNPVPAMVLGRLAVDHRWQGQGIGAGLLRDAVRLTFEAYEIAGIQALLVHAKDEDSKRFYLHHGFAASTIEPMTLMARLKDLA
jgi:GNAT superfamily N-acetyltransferase